MFTIQNENGISAKIINDGASVVSLYVPDKNGNLIDVILGHSEMDLYKLNPVCFGSIVGRVANRISNGKFSMDGKEYQLPLGDHELHLHGGPQGFHLKSWEAENIDDSSIKFTYNSPDGEMGYPGNVDISVVYAISPQNGLRIEISAVTDKPTIMNPTNHAYFNFSGADTILDHEIFIDADEITLVNEQVIPSGEFLKVENTPFDFREAKKIGRDIDNEHNQLIRGKGFDHNWVLNKYDGNIRKVASAYDRQSGIFMDLLTDQPGVQFYTGNYLDGINGKKGTYIDRSGFCFETQFFPDSQNHPHFPSTVLRPGDLYKHDTEYRFSIK